MRTILTLLLEVCLLSLIGCSDPTTSSPNPDQAQSTMPEGDDVGAASAVMDAIELSRESLIAHVSHGVCEILTGCCDLESQISYFAPITTSEFLGSDVERFPTTSPLDYPTCVALMDDIFPKLFIGSWLERIDAGEAELNLDAAQVCLDELEAAECGSASREALFDSTCFSLSAPYGADEQRRYFERSASDGESCEAIRDGFGGIYFGSCDPELAFCCIPDEAFDGGCSPFPGLGKPGTCLPVSELGDACNNIPMQLCKTGLFCDIDTGICSKDEWDPIAIGYACMEGSDYLGECTESYCDFETQLCEPMRSIGDSCTMGFQCENGWCDQDTLLCSSNPICEP